MDLWWQQAVSDRAEPSGTDRQQLSSVGPAASRALSFRLSRAPDGCWTSDPGRTENELLSGPSLDLRFGLCDYQVKVFCPCCWTLSGPGVVGMLTVGIHASRLGRTLHRRIIPAEPDF